MNLAFFKEILNRSVQSNSDFAKTYLYEREACWYIDKVNNAAIYKKKTHTCISCVLNGFKYICQQNIMKTSERVS